MIIDIHSHIDRNYENPRLPEKNLFQDMEKNGIDLRVVSTLEGKSIREQNQYISSLVSRAPDKLAGCAVINPKLYNSVEDTKEALSLPGICMLEFNSVEHGYYSDYCPQIEEILLLAEEKRVPVKMFTGIGSRSMPQQWICHVKRHPRLPFLFLHMGCFDYGYGCIDLALEYKNLYLETSNQYEVQILKKAVTKLPAEKLIFGSSYPERFTKCSLDIFDMFHLEELHKKAIFEENGRCFLKGRIEDSV